MKRAPGGGCFVLLAALATPCRAEEGALSLALTGCEGLSEAALREHLSLELATLGLATARVSLQLRCEPAGFVEVSAGQPPLVARVALHDTERGARERLVALSVSELVAQVERARAARAEEPRAPAAVTVQREPSPPPPAAPRREPRSELSAAASAGSQGAPRLTVWGASLAARLGMGARWALLLDGRWERGQTDLPLAEVRSTSLSGLVGVAARARRGPVELSAGLGVRAGWLSLAAEAPAPDAGRSLTAPWGGVALPLRAAWSSSDLRPFVGVEAGYVTLPVRGTVNGAATLLEQRGAWVSASLGLAVAL